MLSLTRGQGVRSVYNPFKRRRLSVRLHSSSRRLEAPATAFATPPDPTTTATPSFSSYLLRPIPYTVLPTPLPPDSTGAFNKYYPDSPTQDLISIMDACLYNAHDVERAHRIFEDFRATDDGIAALDPRLYNLFLRGYLTLADTDGRKDKAVWIKRAWGLYDSMERGMEKAMPTATTYATLLLLLFRHNKLEHRMWQVTQIMRQCSTRSIPLISVISDPVFTDSAEANEIIELLRDSAAGDLSVEEASRIFNELGVMGEQGRVASDPLAGVPEVRVVRKPQPRGEEQAAEADREIPFNLDILRTNLGKVAAARRSVPDDILGRQRLLEESAYEAALERFKHESEIAETHQLGTSLSKKTVQAWMWEWYCLLEPRLAEDIATLVAQEKRGETSGANHQSTKSSYRNCGIGQFLTLLEPSKLALITILEVMRLQGSGGIYSGMKTTRALIAVGRAVELEHHLGLSKKKNFPHDHTSPDFTLRNLEALKARRLAARAALNENQVWIPEWTQITRATVGSFLVDRLMDTARVLRTTAGPDGQVITELQHAFNHGYEYIRGHKLGVITLNPAIAERLAQDPVRHTLHPRHLPMLVKPKSWITHDSGGYLHSKANVMRYKESSEQLGYIREACERGNLDLVYASLDILGSTPWQINRPVFEVVLNVWNQGLGYPRIPPIVLEDAEPGKPANYETDKKAKAKYLNALKLWNQDRANNHSDRCHVNYKLEIARSFLGDKFYIPHNLDFRGRAYPMPPHLNHIGDDLSRGLLKFGESRPLGERGLRWLKIHLANLYGFDKGSFDERVQFTMDHLDDIYDSAEKPLEGRQWWKTADDPWQCLATCMELRNALESDDPLKFESALPIHQDGTCNGLQHYAALGGDAIGAKQVNLDVTDRPSDVYTYVAEMVEKAIETDAAKGDKIALVLRGKVSRKVVKQTVMTTVYGVTFIGAREQIQKQLRDRGDIEKDDFWAASSYVAKKTLECIGDLFQGAKAIQHWLNMSARLISKSIPEDRVRDALSREVPARLASSQSSAHAKPTDEGESEQVPAEETESTTAQEGEVAPAGAFVDLDATEEMKLVTRIRKAKARFRLERLRKEQMTAVVWTTSLGLPIVQPYRKTKKKQIKTSLQSVYISDPNLQTEVNSMKQASAFPPNFIHSLDATHMMLTSLECRAKGITFSSVHDSYWTHACCIDSMSTIIRETFISLHSTDILEKLYDEFKQHYANHKIAISDLQDRGGRPLVDPLLLDPSAGVTNPNAAEEFEASLGDDTPPAGSVQAEPEHDTTESQDQASKKTSKRKKGKKTPEAVMEERLRTRFVNLVDVLPPLPSKGSFEVQKIKDSLYFFS